MDDQQLLDHGIRLTLAMMKSASTERIRPVDWWTRARTSLETGAAVASTYPEMVSVMGRKLEIEATKAATSEVIAAVGRDIAGHWEAFRRLCETQALYVVALAQAARDEAKAAQQQADQRDLFARDGEVAS